MSSSNCCFLTCIQISQEAGKVVWYSHHFKNFPVFVIRRVKGFSVVSEAEVDAFLEFPCFLYDPMNIGNLIYGSSAISKSSLYIWKFLVHLEPYEQSKNAWLHILSLFPRGGLPRWPSSKDITCNAGDTDLIPGLGRAPGEGNGNPLQYSCLENPMDRGASWGRVHGVAKSQMQLSVCVGVHVRVCTSVRTHTRSPGVRQGHSSWGSSLLCSPFAWQRNKVSLSFFSIALSPYFCLALVHREPAKGRLTRYTW